MKIASIFGGLLLLVASLNTHAFSGTGNENIEFAREFMRYENENGSADTYSFGDIRAFMGKVSGISDGLADPFHKYAICYPKGTNAGQLFELAATYVIENPSERQETLHTLVWKAHFQAFGVQKYEDCWRHDKWLEAQKG